MMHFLLSTKIMCGSKLFVQSLIIMECSARHLKTCMYTLEFFFQLKICGQEWQESPFANSPGDRPVLGRKEFHPFVPVLPSLALDFSFLAKLSGPNLTQNSFRGPEVTLVGDHWFFIFYFTLNSPNNFEEPEVVSSTCSWSIRHKSIHGSFST